jgi:hypothetical protein
MASKDKQNPESQSRVPELRRDWYDKLTIATAILGLAITTAITQLNQCSSAKDTSEAISQLKDLAVESKSQTTVLSMQAKTLADQDQKLKSQVDALIESANANVRAADAAKREADGIYASLRSARERDKITTRPALDFFLSHAKKAKEVGVYLKNDGLGPGIRNRY